MIATNCKIGKTYAPDYSKLDAWALAGLHLKARNAGDNDTCLQIQQAVANLPLNQRVLIGKLKFYKEV